MQGREEKMRAHDNKQKKCVMYKNECSFGCTITMFAALAAIVPSVRNSEKLTDGVRPSGAANIVIVHPNQHAIGRAINRIASFRLRRLTDGMDADSYYRGFAGPGGEPSLQ